MLALIGLLAFWWTQRYEIAKDRLQRELQLGVDEQLAKRVLEIFRFDDAEIKNQSELKIPADESVTRNMQVVILGDTLKEQVIDQSSDEEGNGMTLTQLLLGKDSLESPLATWAENHDRVLNAHLDSLSTSLRIEIIRDDTSAYALGGGMQLNLQQNPLSSKEKNIAIVKNYQSHILLGMWPEFLAGGFLLFLTGLAFWQSSRTLNRQQLLIEDRDELLANMAHELKTPIAGVSAALEALEHFDASEDPSRFKDYIKLSRLEMDRLDKLADQSLLSLQLDSAEGSHLLQLEAADLRKSLLKSWEPLQIKHHLRADQLSMEGDSWPSVEADPRYLTTILSNLLGNAVKYAGEPLAVCVAADKNDGFVHLKISDKGPGIPADQSDRIFDRFYRIKDTEGHRVKGHGLGLSLSRQLARAMGGDLWLDQNYQDGAAFVLKLPAK